MIWNVQIAMRTQTRSLPIRKNNEIRIVCGSMVGMFFFGEVVEGMDVVREIEQVGTESGANFLVTT
jgi:cyclophilin family peptidyl-prolyl cis-trans isomerase